MDGLSVAANVIAVVQVAAELGKICYQYLREVKNAPKDIERVKEQVDATTKLLFHTQKLLEGPYRKKLSASRDLESSLSDCRDSLSYLAQKLEVEFSKATGGKGGRRRDKIFRRFGVSAHDFKWPFTKSEAEEIINRLMLAQELINGALQVDQINVVLSVEQQAYLDKLPIAEGAVFNSFEDEGEPECLPGTRTDLLNDLNIWIAEPKETRIFWLCGMAGTGKSTISRTLARTLSENGQLGASFFFKRGKAHRGDASRFFSTLAMDLKAIIPLLGPHISEAVANDPNVCQKALSEQFQKLLLGPLSKVQQTDVPDPKKALVLVIDALDECGDGEIVGRLIDFLGRLAEVDLNIRIFITSRPEAPIKAGFNDLKDIHKDISLHDIQESTIRDDILAFIRSEFDKIRKNRKLGGSWPGDSTIVTLTDMTVPLFISAATLCRFIGDRKFSVHERLENVLRLRNSSFASKLDQTYRPIFKQILADADETERAELIQGFQEIIGTIVLLESPLGLDSLSVFLKRDVDQLRCLLDQFHSVIKIPDDPATPVQIYHLSFRDYLLDSNNKGRWFHIDAPKGDWEVGVGCLQVLSNALKPDICNLVHPGTKVQSIDSSVRERYIKPEVSYSCQYWVYHVMCSTNGLDLDAQKSETVLYFLEHHLLHWLEVLSILGALDKALDIITKLKSSDERLSKLLQDTILFINIHAPTVNEAPLQLYCSALIFTPNNSVVKRLFLPHSTNSPFRAPGWHPDWGYFVQKIVDSHDLCDDAAFAISPDGKYLAFAEYHHKPTSRPLHMDTEYFVVVQNTVVQITSHKIVLFPRKQIVNPRGSPILSLNFTPDSKYLVIVLKTEVEEQVLLWDLAAGKSFKSISLGPGAQINSQTETALLRRYFYGGSLNVTKSSGLSSDGMFLAFGYPDGTVSVWERLSFESEFQPLYTFHPRPTDGAYIHKFLTIKFGPTSNTLTCIVKPNQLDRADGSVSAIIEEIQSAADAICVYITWDLQTGKVVSEYQYYGKEAPIFCDLSVARNIVAAALPNSDIQIRDASSHSIIQSFEGSQGDEGCVSSLKFSPDGTYLAVGYAIGTIRILDLRANTYTDRLGLLPGMRGEIKCMIFSPDNTFLFFSYHAGVQAWCLGTLGSGGPSQDSTPLPLAPGLEATQDHPPDQIRKFKHQNTYRSMTNPRSHTPGWSLFSPDRKWLALIRNQNLNLWDLISTKIVYSMGLKPPQNGMRSKVHCLEFSPDSESLVVLQTIYAEREPNGPNSRGRLGRWKISRDPIKVEFHQWVGEYKLPDRSVDGRWTRPSFHSLSFSVDNERSFYMIGTKSIEAWDWATNKGTTIYTEPGGRDDLWLASPTPDGLSIVLIRSEDPELSVNLLDISTGSITRRFGWSRDGKFPHGLTQSKVPPLCCQSAVLSADGRILVIEMVNDSALIYDFSAGELIGGFEKNSNTRSEDSIIRSLPSTIVGYHLKINDVNIGHKRISIAASDPQQGFKISTTPRPVDLVSGWLEVKGASVLRLPQELARCYIIGSSESMIVFLLESGDPYFLHFSEIRFPKLPTDCGKQGEHY
ncbi:hypothetical protein TWF718_010416 [Orbilia javanica]|uniref:NACHT domain-containing protein n=1 Tax=Orbilia javanica TaxID=47235 RepID=A0AAN8MSD7_9PEZI